MGVKTKNISVLVIMLVVFWSDLWSGTSGSIEGIVSDKSTGQILVGANVRLLGSQLGASTDINGFFHVGNIPAGTYDLLITFVGYQSLTIRGVEVVPDLKTKINAELASSSVEFNPVEVTAERPPIQKDVTGTMYSSGSRAFAMLPVSNISEVIGMEPGVTLENNVRGGKTTEVVYLLDGLPVQNLIEGGAGSELPQSSIAELSVQTGGFDPEFGNALSGVVNVVTKRGTDKHELVARFDKDDLFGGQQVDHRNELDLSLSGPVSSNIFYFGSTDLINSDTRWWQDLSRFYSSPITKTYSGFGKIDFLPSSSLRFSTQALYSYKQWRDYEYSWRFNLNGLPDRKEEGYRLAAIVSHTPSESFYYTASFSRYTLFSRIGDGKKENVDTTIYQWDFFERYIVTGDRSWWGRREQVNNLLKADFTWRANEHHLIKFGGEFNGQEIYSDIVQYEPQVNIFGKPFVNKLLLDYSTDFKYFPRTGNAYIQDKIEISKDGMLLNLGMRYDVLDPRADRPVAEIAPDPNNVYQTKIDSTVPASIKYVFSPRIGFAAPFAERGYLFINYGKYVQFPLFDYLYSGLNNVSLKKGVGALIGNPDLRPEETRSWEMSLKYALKNGVVLSSTYFHKETINQIDVKTFVPTNSSVAGDYGFAEFVNNPFADASGIELIVLREGENTLTGSVSYTYMLAEGTSEDAREGLQYYEWGLPVPAKPYPLSWDQRHTVKVVATLRLPLHFDLSAEWTYHSGRPYTYFPSKDGFTPEDTTIMFEPNNARLPSYNLLNVKIRHTTEIGSGSYVVKKMTIYLDARNILNARNVLWVDSSGRIGGELEDLSAWDPPRRIRLGVTMDL